MSGSTEFGRYLRQMLLADVGTAGQSKLAAGTAVVVGCGALGTVICDSLVRAGVGTVVIVDRDVVELTNLQRQVLFDEADAREGAQKALAAARRLGGVNSAIRAIPVVADFTSRNAEGIVSGGGGWGRADVVLDGTDNFETRYLLNDVCVKLGVPLVYGGAVGTSGMTMTIVPGSAKAAPTSEALVGGTGTGMPCLRCVFPEQPAPGSSATCDTAGILGPVAQIVASLQAVEGIKVLIGRVDLVARGLRQIDPWTNVWRTIDVGGARRTGADACACCGMRRFEFLDAPADDAAVLCGADSVQVTPRGVGEGGVDLDSLSNRLGAHGRFTRNAHLVRGRLEGERLELTVFRDGRAIVRGTREAVRARAVYAKYIGS